MKILHTIYDDVTNPWLGGGGAIRAFEICRRLTDRHDVTLLVGRYPGALSEEDRDGVRIRRVGVASSYATSRLAFSACASAEVARADFDLWVYSFSAYAPLFASRSLRERSILEFFHIMGSHASKQHPVAGVPARLAETATLRSYPQLIAISPSVRDAIADVRGHHGLHLVYTGINDTCFVDPAEEDYILYFGRFDIYNKGIDLLLEAWSRVAPDYPDIRLALAGRAKPEVSAQLESQAAALGITDRVTFVGGVSEEEKPDLYRRSLFTCMPSRFEGWGITAIEASAAGRAVVATRIPGLVDAVREDGTGLLVPPEDPDALAGAMRKLLEEPQLRTSLGLSGKEWATRFTWDRIAADQEAVYDTVMNERKTEAVAAHE